MSNINITIEFYRPISPEDAKGLIQLLRGAVKVVRDAAAERSQSLEVTEKEKGDAFVVTLSPKSKTKRGKR